LGSLALKALGLHGLANETEWQFLATICSAGYTKSDTKFITLLSAHLFGGQATIGWSALKKNKFSVESKED